MGRPLFARFACKSPTAAPALRRCKLVEDARGKQDPAEGTEGHDEAEGHAEGTDDG